MHWFTLRVSVRICRRCCPDATFAVNFPLTMRAASAFLRVLLERAAIRYGDDAVRLRVVAGRWAIYFSQSFAGDIGLYMAGIVPRLSQPPLMRGMKEAPVPLLPGLRFARERNSPARPAQRSVLGAADELRFCT